MSNPPRHVVVGFDFTPHAVAALQRAVALATSAEPYRLHIVCALEHGAELPGVPRDTPVDYLYADTVQKAVADIIGLELELAQTGEGMKFDIHARIGKPADEILAVASELGADLIIVGSHGRVGIERLVLGSVAERVVREAGCTVEVARAKRYSPATLIPVTRVEAKHTYVPPHRYCYEDRRVLLRPAEWPLY